jgi:hypothetical protein
MRLARTSTVSPGTVLGRDISLDPRFGVPLLRAGIAAGRGSPCSLGAREPLGRRAAEPGERAAVPLACALATGTPLARA